MSAADFHVDDPGPYLKLDAQLCYRLVTSARLITEAYRPILAPLGVSYLGYMVMMAVWEDDGLSIAALADRMHLPALEIEAALSDLVEDGFVERTGEEVWGTDRGWHLKEQSRVVPNAIRCRLLLPEPEIRSVSESLDALIHNIRDTKSGAPESRVT